MRRGYTAPQLHNAEVASTVSVVVGAVITIGLWLWMVHATATLIVAILIWLVGLAAIVLLFRRKSSYFYQRQTSLV